MSDPRWTNINDPRKLIKKRQPGLEAGQDFVQIVTENDRRDIDNAVAEEGKPPIASPVQPLQPPAPILPKAGPDRFHKKGSVYATVSKLHNSGEDTVADPAAFHTIVEGYAYCKDVLVPKLIDPATERVTLYIFGGQYEEDVVFDSANVDVVAEGRVILKGSMTITPTLPRQYIAGFDIIAAGSTTCLLTINEFIGDHHEERLPGVIFRDMRLSAEIRLVDASARFLFVDSDFYYLADFDATLASCGIKIRYTIQWQRWAEFWNCELYSVPASEQASSSAEPTDNYYDGVNAYTAAPKLGTLFWFSPHANGLLSLNPMIDCSTATDGTETAFFSSQSTVSTGVHLDHCTIFGIMLNKCWTVVHEYCYCQGGLQGILTPGTIYSYQWVLSTVSLNVGSFTQFFHCQVNAANAGWIQEQSLPPLFTTPGYVWFNHSHHVSDSVTSAGSTFIDGTSGQSWVYVEHSDTTSANWTTANLYASNSPVSEPIIPGITLYYP